MTLAQLTKEQLEDMSLIDMAYVILENNNKQTVAFTEIMDIIVAATGLSETVVRAKIAQFYTDMNIDGRFLCMGDNRWGLRSWYPVEQAEEDTITQLKPKKKGKKKLKDDDDYDMDDYDDQDDDDFDDLDEYEEDDVLEDDEDIFDLDDEDDEEDVEDFDDEELLEDEEEVFDALEDDGLAEDDEDEEEELEFEDDEEDK